MKHGGNLPLTEAELNWAARYLTLALGVWVNPEDYKASVQHAILEGESENASFACPSDNAPRQLGA